MFSFMAERHLKTHLNHEKFIYNFLSIGFWKYKINIRLLLIFEYHLALNILFFLCPQWFVVIRRRQFRDVSTLLNFL